jgi:hypothetical protein
MSFKQLIFFVDKYHFVGVFLHTDPEIVNEEEEIEASGPGWDIPPPLIDDHRNPDF